MNKKEFRSKDRKFFIDYISDDILKKMDEEMVQHLYRYRDYHRYIHDRMVKIELLEEQIDKLKKKISKHKEAVEGEKIDGIVQTSGFKDKMIYHYDFVKHFDTNLRVTSWVEKNSRKSTSLRKKEGEDVSVSPSFNFRNTHKGEPLKTRDIWLGKVEIQKKRKTFYLGLQTDILDELMRLLDYTDDNLSEWEWVDVKDEIKMLLNQFSRYHIFHKSVPEFRKMENMSLSRVIDWCLEMDNKPNDKGVSPRYDWS